MKKDLTFILKFSLTIIAINIISVLANCQSKDFVDGNLIQFSNNGFYCWYQDERALVDTSHNKIVFGYVTSSSGVGGSLKNGVISAGIFDLQSRTTQQYDLLKTSCDDHNAPGFYIRPDGKYIAMFAQHYDAYNSRYRIFSNGVWAPEVDFDWKTIPGSTDYTIAYSNLYYMSSEKRLYNFARANHRAPNFLYSDDMGDTWHFGGQLTTNSSSSYNKGYYKYWGNGIDRIDFIFTEQHPRDTSTSIYHGYIQNGKSYTSDGTLADANIYNTTYLPSFKNFTKVFADNTIINGVAMRRCWNTDLMRYNDSTIVTIITAREDDNVGGGSSSVNPEHSFIYCYYDGKNWTYHFLAKAGLKMYPSEQDYTGLAAVHPDNPNVIYISTHYDPLTNVNIGKREIFKGVTNNHGISWVWTAITYNSTRDNYRPIVPKWDTTHTALIWLRGTYSTAQSFDAAVVGLIENNTEPESVMHYFDATTSNSMQTDGNMLTTTGPGAGDGAADNNIKTFVFSRNNVCIEYKINFECQLGVELLRKLDYCKPVFWYRQCYNRLYCRS
jgi:hypothetical protein